jgi:hypothetical protein
LAKLHTASEGTEIAQFDTQTTNADCWQSGMAPKFFVDLYIFSFWREGWWCWWGGECFDHALKEFLATSCFIFLYPT